MQKKTSASRIRIVLDAMGGDFGPSETVKGAVQALNLHNVEITLVGDQQEVELELSKYNADASVIKVVASEGKIGDHEHPITALRQKKDSSILVATKLLKNGEADALISVGSTGASMASAVMVLGLMEGLDRPCLGGPFLGLCPRTILVDMGSNVDCRPSLLVSFGALGSAFSKYFLGISEPRVGLLSVGSEEAKGNRSVQESFQLFQDSHLNFIGNVEGMDFFTDRADVIVCDGFVGNILLKFTEGFGSAMGPYLYKKLSEYLPEKDVKKVIGELWQNTNIPRTMGGPLFGVNGAVILGHGSSTADGICGAVGTAIQYVELGLMENMRAELARLHNPTGIKV